MTDRGLKSLRALKIIPKDKIANSTNFFSEAQTLKAAEHPNIVRAEETGLFADGSIYVAMEYLRRGSVADEASGAALPMTRAKQLMIDTLRGLAHAHGRNIIHRDIKPANILIGPANEGKLSDFGLALDLATPDALAVKDYAYIMHLAPEVERAQDCSRLSDIYAAGVTLYRLINGDRSLASLSISEVRGRTKAGMYPNRSEYRDYIPRKLKEVVNTALEVAPANRFAEADEMRRALERVTIKVNWDERELTDGTRWRGRSSSHRYEVLRKATALGWAVVVRKAKAGGKLRVVTALSKAALAEDAARRWSRGLLQDLSVGKMP